MSTGSENKRISKCIHVEKARIERYGKKGALGEGVRNFAESEERIDNVGNTDRLLDVELAALGPLRLFLRQDVVLLEYIT